MRKKAKIAKQYDTKEKAIEVKKKLLIPTS